MRTQTYKTTYADLVALTPHSSNWAWALIGLLVVASAPLLLGSHGLNILSAIFVMAIGILGLNLLTGVTGQISLGHAGFLLIGAYAQAILTTDYHLPAWLAIFVSGLVAAAASLVVGVPSLRLKGLYLAITTLAGSTAGATGSACAATETAGVGMLAGGATATGGNTGAATGAAMGATTGAAARGGAGAATGAAATRAGWPRYCASTSAISAGAITRARTREASPASPFAARATPRFSTTVGDASGAAASGVSSRTASAMSPDSTSDSPRFTLAPVMRGSAVRAAR